MRLIAVLFGLLALAACSHPGSLSYVPPDHLVPGPQGSVAAVTVVDRRDEKPNRVATIRGGYGNPLSVLDTVTPVSDQVGAVFIEALRARGMLAPAAPYRFQVVLHTLYGDQFMGRRAEIKMDLAVIDPAGRVVYSDTVADQGYEFTFFTNGVFADIGDLLKVVDQLLSKSINRLLDSRALDEVLAAPPPAAVPALALPPAS